METTDDRPRKTRVPPPTTAGRRGCCIEVEISQGGVEKPSLSTTVEDATSLLYNTRRWKRTLFDLVRHVKHDLGGDASQAEAAVRDWLATDTNPPHSDVALRYAVQAWDRAMQGTAADTLTVACQRALTGEPVPPMPEPIGLVWRVCWHLASMNPAFFCPCDAAGRLLGMPSMHVWRALRRLVEGGHIEIVTKGDRYTGPAEPGETRAPARATRYRWRAAR